MITLSIMKLETLSIIYVKNFGFQRVEILLKVLLINVNKCSVCQKFEGPCYDYPKLGPLPYSRANFDFPYLSIGVDYAGPFYVRNIYNTKDNSCKAWIVFITYCSSRCKYLDIVPDCYGNSCIDNIKRFISIHGAPKLIISDNGPTFSEK